MLYILHYHISVVVEDVVAFSLSFYLKAFQLHLCVDFGHFFIGHYVLVIQSCKCERNSCIPFLNIFLGGHEVTQISGFSNPKNLEVVPL